MPINVHRHFQWLTQSLVESPEDETLRLRQRIQQLEAQLEEVLVGHAQTINPVQLLQSTTEPRPNDTTMLTTSPPISSPQNYANAPYRPSISSPSTRELRSYAAAGTPYQLMGRTDSPDSGYETRLGRNSRLMAEVPDGNSYPEFHNAADNAYLEAHPNANLFNSSDESFDMNAASYDQNIETDLSGNDSGQS
jgi:hypothetical protein